MMHDDRKRYFETYEEQIRVLKKRIALLDKDVCIALSERDVCIQDKGFLEGKIAEYKSRIR